MVALAHPILQNSDERKAWLRSRKKHVTATDVYTLFGFGWDGFTVADLAADKRTDDVPDEPTPPERVRMGLELEPVIRARYTERTGIAVRPSFGLTVDAVNPLRAASLDAVDDAERAVELKSVFSPPGDEWGKHGTDHVPEKYIIQTTWQAGIMGQAEIDLGALFVGYDFRVYTVPFVPALFDVLTAGAIEFMDAVKAGVEIPATWRPSSMPQVEKITLDILKSQTFALPPEADELFDRYAKAAADAKDADARKDDAKRALVALVGPHDKGIAPGGGKVSRWPVKGFWRSVSWSEPRIESGIYPPKRRAL